MSRIKTDMMALTAILGSAIAGGVVTMALMGSSHPVDHRCRVEATSVSPEVMVVTGVRAPSVVVTRSVGAHSSHECVAVLEKEMAHAEHMLHSQVLHLEQLEAMEHMEDLNIHFEEMEIQLDGLEFHFEGMGDGLAEDFEAELEARIQVEMDQVRAKLEGKGIF